MHPELFTIRGFAVPGYGFMVLVSFLAATWWMARRSRQVKLDPDIVLNLGFIALFFSTAGARAFYVIHYWDEQFAANPGRILDLRSGGFEFYGGFLGAFVACWGYLKLRKLPVRLYADLVTPSLLLGMGLGRIGCFLFGCCWGSTCPANLPWAVQFPYSSPAHIRQWQDRQASLPAEMIFVEPSGEAGPVPRQILYNSDRLATQVKMADKMVEDVEKSGNPEKVKAAALRRDQAKASWQLIQNHMKSFETTPAELASLAQQPEYRSLHVHPAQIYGAVGPLLLAALTSAYFYRRQRHGTVMCLGYGLYAIERFLEEMIRSDNPQDTFGLTVSQGVSIGILAVCILSWLYLRTLPEKAPIRTPAVKPQPATATPGPTA